MQPRIILLRQNTTGQGGAENYLRLLCSALVAQNHQIILLSDSAPADTPPLPVEILRPTSTVLSPFACFPVRAEAWCQKNLARGDVVLSLDRNRRQHILRTGDGVHAAWLNVRAAAGRLSPLDSLRHTRLLRLEKLAFSPERTALIWANSHWVAAQIRQLYNFPAERIHVIHNGVDTARWNWKEDLHLPLPSPIPQFVPVILFVGSGWWRKGWDIAVRTHAELRKKIPLAWLVGVGKRGRETAFIETLYQKNVVWLGQVDPDMLSICFAASSLLLLPTRYDPFSNIVLEALASGLPVLTSTENGASEIFQNTDPACGCALPITDSPESWAAAAEQIIKLGRTELVRQNCRSLAEKFDLSAHIPQVLHLVHLAREIPLTKNNSIKT